MCKFSKMKWLILFQVSLILVVSVSVFAGELRGIVVEKYTQNPLGGATVVVVGGSIQTATDSDGRFSISDVPAGEYTIQASMKGYEAARIRGVMVIKEGSTEVTIELNEVSIVLEEIIVTPGRFTLMRKEPTVQQTLKRDDLRSVPQLGEDIYRAVARLPGIATDDYSAQFTVRGGEKDEVLVLLDGIELYEPFHLKDISGGIFSIIDVETIGSLDMMTGSFPAAYGNRLSGVFDMKSAKPSFTDRRRTSLAISLMNARFLSEGYFSNQRGHWLFAARRGYLDLLLRITEEGDDTSELSPVYYDISGKLAYELNEKHAVSASVLWADDDLDVAADLDFAEGQDTFNTGYGNGYAWLTWKAKFHPGASAQTVLSVGRVTTDRSGTDLSDGDATLVASVSEKRAFNLLGLKQDWTAELSRRHLLMAGFDAKRLEADYNYYNQYTMRHYTTADGEVIREYDSTTSDRELSGERFGVYLSDRVRLLGPLAAEIGVRYDHFSWTDDNNVSPRLNIAYSFRDRTVLRGGWGRFYQSQGIHELNVQDGDETFYPAELAEHRVISLEHVFENEINLRVEAYQKALSDIHPRYQNLSGDIAEAPEVEYDRVRLEPKNGESKGVEVFLKRDAGDRLSWWASYAYAIAEDEIEGQEVPKNYDQRHTVYLDLNYRPNPKWRYNVAWQFHTGWPYTARNWEQIERPDGSTGYTSSFGPVNAERFSPYHRLDVRVHRYFNVRNGRLSIFAEVRNLYNRSNIRRYHYSIWTNEDGEQKVIKDAQEWLPIVPSIGVNWEF